MSVKQATNAVRMRYAGTTMEAFGVTRKTPVKSLMCAHQKSKFIFIAMLVCKGQDGMC